MAGSIIISVNLGVSMSSVVFDHVVEETRKEFAESEKKIMEDIYGPYDHQAQMFINLNGQPAEVIRAFLRATSAAKAKGAQDGYALPQNDWSELCEKLSRDPRSGVV